MNSKKLLSYNEHGNLDQKFFFWDNYSKPTWGLARFHFAYPWFKTLHFAHLNFNPLPIRYPPLLKSGVKMYFIFTIMSLSSKNKK